MKGEKDSLRKSFSLENLTEAPKIKKSDSGKSVVKKVKLIEEVPSEYKVQINGSKIIKDEGGKKFTTYTLIIQNSKGSRWEIYRRYSEFRTFMENLKANYKKVPKGFPPKKLLNNLNQATIDKRQVELQSWIDKVVRAPSLVACPEVFSFLEEGKIRVFRDKSKKKKFASDSYEIQEIFTNSNEDNSPGKGGHFSREESDPDSNIEDDTDDEYDETDDDEEEEQAIDLESILNEENDENKKVEQNIVENKREKDSKAEKVKRSRRVREKEREKEKERQKEREKEKEIEKAVKKEKKKKRDEDDEDEEEHLKKTFTCEFEEEEVDYKGHLFKLYFNEWKKRWFVLSNNKLYKFRSHKEKRPYGSYHLTKRVTVNQVEIKIDDHRDVDFFQFIVCTPKGKKMIFATKSEKERSRWINVIQKKSTNLTLQNCKIFSVSIDEDVNTRDEQGVPLFISSLINYILDVAITDSHEECNGDKYFTNQLQIDNSIIDNIENRTIDPKTLLNPTTVCSLIIKYFEYLPNSLLPFVLYDNSIKLTKNGDGEIDKAAKNNVLNSIIGSLSPVHFNLALKIINLLTTIIFLNKPMYQQPLLENYVKIFSPLLFKDSHSKELKEDREKIQEIQNILLIHLITNSNQFFPATKEIILNKEDDDDEEEEEEEEQPVSDRSASSTATFNKRMNRNTVHYNAKSGRDYYRTYSPRRGRNSPEKMDKDALRSMEAVYFTKSIKKLKSNLKSKEFNDVQKLVIEDQLLTLEIDYENHKIFVENENLKEVNQKLKTKKEPATISEPKTRKSTIKADKSNRSNIDLKTIFKPKRLSVAIETLPEGKSEIELLREIIAEHKKDSASTPSPAANLAVENLRSSPSKERRNTSPAQRNPPPALKNIPSSTLISSSGLSSSNESSLKSSQRPTRKYSCIASLSPEDQLLIDMLRLFDRK